MKQPNKIPRSLKPRTERDKMIESQLWKTTRIAKEVNSFTGLPVDELKSVAQSFLTKIWDSYDPKKGANFSTWVNRCLYFHILNYLRDNSRLVKMPRSYSEIYLKIRKEQKKNPSINSRGLSIKLDITEESINEVLQAFSCQYIPVGISNNNNNNSDSTGGPGDDVEYSIYKARPELYDNNHNSNELNFIETKYKRYYQVIESLSDTEFNLLEDALLKGRSFSYLRKNYGKLIKKEPDLRNYIDSIKNRCQNL